MNLFGNYIFRILCCAVLCSIVIILFPEGKMKELVRTCTGIVLTVVLLSPAVKCKLPDMDAPLEEFYEQGKTVASAGGDYAIWQRQKIIKETLEAYIIDKGSSMIQDLYVCVEVDTQGIPTGVDLYGSYSHDEKQKMTMILEEELGIAKEDQRWNGQQKNVQSEIP